LWSESDTIIVGVVASITSEESGERDYHYVEIEVERYFKNPQEASSLVVLHHTRSRMEFVTPEGTTINDIVSNVEWGFNVGERVYVFLRNLTPEYYEVYGGHQGKYTIVDGIAFNSVGRKINIPTPASPTVLMSVGLGAAALIAIWIRRDWLFERIVGVNNG